MSETRTIFSLGVEKPGQAYYFQYEEAPPQPGQFRVDTLYSGFSSGTELTLFHGTNPYLNATWDAEQGVFRPGEVSTHYPIPFLGYMEVGVVTESCSPVVAPGEIVAAVYGHKSGHTLDANHDFFVRLPPGLDPILGIYVAQMGPICANGLLHAAAQACGPNIQSLGDGVRGRNVVVIGAGVVGILTALFAKFHGAADVVISNVATARLDCAAALGLTTVSEAEQSLWQFCKERWHYGPADRGADLVFQCKADPESLSEALRCLRPQGTVIDLAFYQGGAPNLRLGEEFHHNGLMIRCAQINNLPLGSERIWHRQRLAHETLHLLHHYGPLIQAHLITDVVAAQEAPSFFAQLAATYHPEVIQAVIKWEEHCPAPLTVLMQPRLEEFPQKFVNEGI